MNANMGTGMNENNSRAMNLFSNNNSVASNAASAVMANAKMPPMGGRRRNRKNRGTRKNRKNRGTRKNRKSRANRR